MTDIEWGAEIAVDGKRPEWLRDEDKLRWYGRDTRESFWKKFGHTNAKDLYWDNTIVRIRLIADHPYYRKRTEQSSPTIAPELVERMVALMAYMATGAESIFEQYHPVNTGLGKAYSEAKAINDALRPEDPDLTLAKSIVGDAEAIALAIKAARENGR